MKLIKTAIFVLGTLFWFNTSLSQDNDSLGVIGDNLDLYAVLDAFKDAESMEAFEETINNPEKKINNLDLDENGEVDYIQVHDEGEGDVHALILRIAMSEYETQDVAVIELEKSGTNEATIQIVGDEEIYGENYIVEPKNPEDITKRMMRPSLIIVNVWGWRGVKFIYAPAYVRWRSPWHWQHHPKWWRPRAPYSWRIYNGFHRHHRKHFHVVRVHRCNKAHIVYKNKRRTTVKIKKHHHHHNNKAGHHKHNGHNHHKGHHKTNNGPKTSKGDKHKHGNKNQKSGNKQGQKKKGAKKRR